MPQLRLSPLSISPICPTIKGLDGSTPHLLSPRIIMLLTHFICVFLMSTILGPNESPVEAVIQRHQAYLDSIRSLDCKVVTGFASKGDDIDLTYFEGEIIRESGKERLLETFFGAYGPDGKWTKIISHYDKFYDGQQVLVLENFDRTSPPKEPLTFKPVGSGRRFSGVGGWIAGARSNGEAGGFAIDRVLFSATPSLTVSGLARKADEAKVTRDDGKIVSLQIIDRKNKITYDFDFDVQKNYPMSKRKISMGDGSSVTTRTSEAVRFDEPKPGLFVPKLLRSSDSSQLKGWVTEVNYKSVNEVIESSRFAFRYPDGLPVINKVEAGDPTISLYRNNRPTQTFKNTQDLEAFLLDTPEPSWSPWPIIGTVVVLLILVGLELIRRLVLR